MLHLDPTFWGDTPYNIRVIIFLTYEHIEKELIYALKRNRRMKLKLLKIVNK